MAAAREGSEWALAALYRELQPRLLGYLRTRDWSEAEDIASETWMAVTRGLPRFQGDEVAVENLGSAAVAIGIDEDHPAQTRLDQ